MLVDPHKLTALMVSIVFFPASPVSPCVSPATYKIQSLQLPLSAAEQLIHLGTPCILSHSMLRKIISPIPIETLSGEIQDFPSAQLFLRKSSGRQVNTALVSPTEAE